MRQSSIPSNCHTHVKNELKPLLNSIHNHLLHLQLLLQQNLSLRFPNQILCFKSKCLKILYWFVVVSFPNLNVFRHVSDDENIMHDKANFLRFILKILLLKHPSSFYLKLLINTTSSCDECLTLYLHFFNALTTINRMEEQYALISPWR